MVPLKDLRTHAALECPAWRLRCGSSWHHGLVGVGLNPTGVTALVLDRPRRGPGVVADRAVLDEHVENSAERGRPDADVAAQDRAVVDVDVLLENAQQRRRQACLWEILSLSCLKRKTQNAVFRNVIQNETQNELKLMIETYKTKTKNETYQNAQKPAKRAKRMSKRTF